VHCLDELAGPGLTAVSQDESDVRRAQTVETPAVNGSWAVNRRERHAVGVKVRVVITV
jgi:hypothetical protein